MDKKEKLSLVEKTERNILGYISSHIDANDLPKEQEFVEILGVSRVVVREALSRLRAIGIIETKRKKGTVLASPPIFGTLKVIVESGCLTKETLKDLYELRLMLEIGMADFIYMNKTEEQMDELEQIVSQGVAIHKEIDVTEDPDRRRALAIEATQKELEFHSTLFRMTGNKSLMDFQNIMKHLFTHYNSKVDNEFHRQTLVSHVILFNILREGTPDAFRTAMRLHLNTQFLDMEAILGRVSGKY